MFGEGSWSIVTGKCSHHPVILFFFLLNNCCLSLLLVFLKLKVYQIWSVGASPGLSFLHFNVFLYLEGRDVENDRDVQLCPPRLWAAGAGPGQSRKPTAPSTSALCLGTQALLSSVAFQGTPAGIRSGPAKESKTSRMGCRCLNSVPASDSTPASLLWWHCPFSLWGSPH